MDYYPLADMIDMNLIKVVRHLLIGIVQQKLIDKMWALEQIEQMMDKKKDLALEHN